ncbi:MAG: NAD-binding protein [Bacteroidales bacterium]
MNYTSRREIIIAGILVLIIVFIGVIGYMLIDDYTFISALYMTVITVATVGFGEVEPLSDAGRLFTVGLILSSLVVLGYFVSALTQHLVHSQLSFFYSGNNKNRRIKNMENHVIVVGYGRNGQQVVDELRSMGTEVIVVDESHEIVINNMGKPFRFIEGDATNDEILIKANIKSAKSLISTLPNDADNLFVVLTARSLKHDLKIISRASSDSTEKKLRMAGVDSVVMPERVGGAHMATLVTKPDIVEFLEHLSIKSDTPTLLMEIMCSDIPTDLLNKPISEIGIRKKSGANIIGYKTAAGEVIVNPAPNTKLQQNSKLFVLGTIEQIQSMKELLETKS